MIKRIKNKLVYWQDILSRQIAADRFCSGHQVSLHNWSHPVIYDRWLIDFIEKRGLLKNKPKAKIALYSIFGPLWLTMFDRADIRIFVERENLHKASMQQWLHRCLDDNRFDLSLGFDQLNHRQYLHFPFWIMWSVFSPTATYEDIEKQLSHMDSVENHSYKDRKFCSFVCSHDDVGRKNIYEQFSKIDKIDCDGKLFHNNDELKQIYNDDKLQYLKHYKFNLTPENTNYKGYVTEKLFEAIKCGCIPIYNGSDNCPEPEILNQSAIIFIEIGKENTDAIKLVSELNSNEKLYMDFACQKRFIIGGADIIWNYYTYLEKELKEIIANL